MALAIGAIVFWGTHRPGNAEYCLAASGCITLEDNDEE